MATQSHRLDLGDRHLMYDVTPPGAPNAAGPPTVVLLHGIANARSSWDDVLPALAAHTSVVRLDFRGHGESSPTPARYQVADYADDVVAVLSHLGIAPAVLVGHSLGGLTAAWLAVHRPELVAAVVLVDPPLFTTGPADAAGAPFPAVFARRQADARRWHETGASPADVAAELGAEASVHGGTNADHWSPATLDRLARARLAHDPAAFDPTLQGALAPDWDPDAATLACPALLVLADPSRGAAVTAAHRARLDAFAPGAIVVTYDGASHMVHLDAPARIVADILAFVAGVGG